MRASLRPYLITGLLLAAALALSVAFGAVSIPLGDLLRILLDQLPGLNFAPDWPATFAVILLQVRLPHTLLVALAGAALAGSGAAYQGLFRNPLADPYLIGVASGAGLGAVLALSIRWPSSLLGYYFIPAAAFLGALLTMLIVYGLARVGGTVPLTTLILAGVAVGSFASAATSYLMLRADDQIYRAIAFLLGGSLLGGWKPVLALAPYLTLGFGLLALSGHSLNVLQSGEEEARQMGLSVERAKVFIILTATLTTAAAVAFSGVIGFVGLIVPHILRMLWGPDYRRLIPLSILGGAAALLLSDLLARLLLAPRTLPTGIVTSLVGVPFFLWVLRRAKNEVFW